MNLQTIITTKQAEAREALHDHPAMKFANDAVLLAAIRSGTKGYPGEKNLSDFVDELVESTAKAVLEAVKGEAMKEYVHKFPENIPDLGLAKNLISRDALLARLEEMEKGEH